MSNYHASIGITDHDYCMLEYELEELAKIEIKDLRKRGYDDWGDYIKYDIDMERTYRVTDTYVVPYNKKRNHHTIMTKRREEYYKSYTWLLRRNDVLWSAKFICAGCGGVATQAHHQASSREFGNYAHIGDSEESKELNDLVSVCGQCHVIITNVQNINRRIRNPRTFPIVLNAYSVPSPQIDMFSEVLS